MTDDLTTCAEQGAEELFVMAWVMASGVKILQPSERVASESTMNLTYQTVVQSRYKPGKVLEVHRSLGGCVEYVC